MASSPVPLRLKLPYATEDEFLVRFAPSLSRGGIFVATQKPKAAGTLIAFRFVLADGTPVLSGEGTVERATEPGGAERAGMVLRFTALDPKSRERVDRVAALKEGKAEAPPPARPPAVADAPASAEEKRRRRLAVLDGPKGAVSPSSPEPVLGIDLGTTICRAAVHHGGQVKLLELEPRSTALPAVVAFDDRGNLLLGTRAKAQLLVDPKSAFYGTKRLLGRRARAQKVRAMAAHFPFELCADEQGDAAVKAGDRVLTAAQLAGLLLAEIRNRASESLGRPVGRAVICVPAHYNDRQLHALRYAAQLAELKVERIVTEPAAVGVAYGYGRGLARKRILIFDLGGGTFDASVVEVTGDDFAVIAAGGDNFLGGLDFDARVAAWLEERFCEREGLGPVTDPLTRQRIRDAAEAAKIALSERPSTRVHVPYLATRGSTPVDLDVELSRAQFEELIHPLVYRAIEVTRAILDAKGLSPGSLDEVLFVGGQSLTPLVHSSLESLIGRPLEREVDPQNAVATGAAIVGRAMRDDDPTLFSLRFTEVLSSPIGIALSDGSFSKVLDSNLSLPAEKTCTVPVGAGRAVRLAVYQGESAVAEQNEYLGALQVEAVTGREVNLVFSVSRDGVLAIFLRNEEGERVALTLATADAPDHVRRELLACAPLPDEDPHARSLLGGLRKLFGKR
jgi:molecular chaperone DnaK